MQNVNRPVIIEKEKLVVPADIVDSVGFIRACAKCVDRNGNIFNSLPQEPETTVDAHLKKNS